MPNLISQIEFFNDFPRFSKECDSFFWAFFLTFFVIYPLQFKTNYSPPIKTYILGVIAFLFTPFFFLFQSMIQNNPNSKKIQLYDTIKIIPMTFNVFNFQNNLDSLIFTDLQSQKYIINSVFLSALFVYIIIGLTIQRKYSILFENFQLEYNLDINQYYGFAFELQKLFFILLIIFSIYSSLMQIPIYLVDLKKYIYPQRKTSTITIFEVLLFCYVIVIMMGNLGEWLNGVTGLICVWLGIGIPVLIRKKQQNCTNSILPALILIFIIIACAIRNVISGFEGNVNFVDALKRLGIKIQF